MLLVLLLTAVDLAEKRMVSSSLHSRCDSLSQRRDKLIPPTTIIAVGVREQHERDDSHHSKDSDGSIACRIQNSKLKDGVTRVVTNIHARRKALERVACVAKPDTILAWYRRLIAQKSDDSKEHSCPVILE